MSDKQAWDTSTNVRFIVWRGELAKKDHENQMKALRAYRKFMQEYFGRVK